MLCGQGPCPQRAAATSRAAALRRAVPSSDGKALVPWEGSQRGVTWGGRGFPWEPCSREPFAAILSGLGKAEKVSPCTYCLVFDFFFFLNEREDGNNRYLRSDVRTRVLWRRSLRKWGSGVLVTNAARQARACVGT